MPYRALHSIVAIAWCFGMAIPRAEAQLAPLVELQPGARVRVKAPEVFAGSLEATVVTRARDTVTLTRQHGAPIHVPLARIKAAEVSRGRTHRDGAVTGLAWGASVGLAIGLLSAVTYDARSTACGVEPCENNFSSGEVIAGGFIAGAALGAGIGAIKGAEHWDHLTIPTPYIALRPGRAGMALALAIAF